ncbi:glycosyl hydrolase family 3 N terminal domain-containing protein [Colletotrichum graminicola]|uniref:beta-glucosidase n=1 Tax=Colletotrichum graminicola (strain M1.001 / M2 / FGSC 10212) TaxID=645133 RepID=E3QNX1_COLGM|nr:glycosyl hydrolase family 3 N terminal domain-containing protein [Colletotrichum graminicola M1.001]EFQ32559.1 glycosyl hydrolase family 3 N terminal domain-containing protein [Colletotrichum graminicola M1.001]WDK18341.1 glycosyl hydrolase family 3 N terminal domain-containing protein [Colletotrichum graminicola]
MDPSNQGLLDKSRGSYDRDSEDGSDIDVTDYLPRNDQKEESSFPKPAFLSNRFPGCLAALKRACHGRSRLCLLVTALAVIMWIIISAGGAVMYKKFKSAPPTGQSPPWYPTPKGGISKNWAESYKIAAEMVSRMTLPEKVNITTGTGWMMGLAVGTTGPAVHVGFPQLQLQDGPLGIRFADNATAFPAGVTVGATWNRELMYERGKAHGQEARGKGINVLLGPCIGPLGRLPAGGRNWEGFAADPYLQGIAAAETIKGIQDQGVMATIKHFVANEQEHFRQSWEWGLPNAMSSNVGDRAMHELYAWPFLNAVKAGVASVMCSYNMVNNSYACGNSKLLNGILKDEMGFQGFVMSDWLAQRSGVDSALAGLDMTMPGDGLFWSDGKSLWGPELTKAVLNGSVPVDRLNDMVVRIVASWYQLGQDDKKLFPNELPNFSSWTDDKMGTLAPGSKTPQVEFEVNKYVNVQSDHSDVARRVAAEGTVLLKNENVLPISKDGFIDAKRKRHEGKLKIGIYGEDAGPGNGPNYCKDRGCNQGTLGSGWGSGAVEFPYLVAPVEALKKAFKSEKVELSEFLTNSPPFKKDPSILHDQDVCIVFANADSGEGFLSWGGISGDRNDLKLQKGGDDLILQVADNCGKGDGNPVGGDTIVVIHSVGPVEMERWIEHPGVKAVLYANLPGQESGNALADVILGDVNPSGKLPYTIPKSLKDFGPGGQILYLPNGIVPQQDFSEGLYIDYRHFDKQEIEPRFEFGFGLSYTTFDFSNVVVEGVKPKSPLPAARPPPAAEPPKFSDKIPEKKEVLFPEGFRKLEKYVYPYLDTVDDISTEPYPYPEGYDVEQPLSEAGGEEGGNPDLWEIYVTVKADVTNTGAVAGKVVPQLYLTYPKDVHGVDFPVKVLRGFDKFNLEKGEKKTVTFNLTRRDLSYWDVHRQNWVMVTSGEYSFLVGESSRQLSRVGSW